LGVVLNFKKLGTVDPFDYPPTLLYYLFAENVFILPAENGSGTNKLLFGL
jgi:hypothetical protein